MTSLHERFVPVSRSCPPGFGDGNAAATMPALHPKRAEKVDFVMYKAPPAESVADKAIFDEWITRATFIEDDLRWLLQLPHDRFWCQVVFNSSLRQCIGSFLHHAPRPFDLEVKLSCELKQKNDTLHRLFFFVCLRMSTHKESKDNHISPEVFGEILYENFIFDIPKIMDICVLYGKSNESLVSKMVANIFAQQRKYYDDLQAIVPTIMQVFDAVCSNCGFRGDSLSPPKRITNKASHQKNPLATMPTDKFQDIIFYLSDISHTLRSFLEIFPPGSSSFSQDNFPQRLATFYEAISSGFALAFRERQKQLVDDSLPYSLRRIMCFVKVCLLHVFHHIVFNSFLQPLLESTSEESTSEFAEGYVNLLTAILSEKRFLADLQMLFPFGEDKDILKQSVYKIDQTRFEYIEDAILEAEMAYGIKPKKDAKKQSTTPGLKPDPILETACTNDQYQAEDDESDRYDELGACAPRKTGVELDSLIYIVKDLLPDLGDGFIKLCLEEYSYDSEKVISAILDNSLPPRLQNVDRMLQRSAVRAEVGSMIKAELNGSASEVEQKSLLAERLNIYDGDEFDVFQNKVDTSRVHIGKMNKTVVDSKSELSSFKSFYKKYEDVVEMVEGGDDDYDDEYDDTYDSNAVGMIDDDSPDELVARRPFVTPRILEKAEPRKKADRGLSEEEDSEEERKKRDHFIEDPARLRQMREERFAAQHSNQRRSKGHHIPSTDNGQEVNRDVKGGPKGQGQNAEVLRNRAYKERHKDSRVHHNRRDLADRKRKV